MWDKQTQTIVNNESIEIVRMFDVEFAALSTRQIDLYPPDFQQQIDDTIGSSILTHHTIALGLVKVRVFLERGAGNKQEFTNY